MTTSIKVTSHNHPALVQTFDHVWDADKQAVSADLTLAFELVLRPEDGEREFYCTTTREVCVVDLEYDDPRVSAKS